MAELLPVTSMLLQAASSNGAKAAEMLLGAGGELLHQA